MRPLSATTPDPVARLVADREAARATSDPMADTCVLATADGGPAPSVRPLVLRDVGPQGLGLLISATSLKWDPLRAGRYECLLLWTTIRRQYRVRGSLAPMPEALVEAYWQQKIHASRLLDVYYETARPQSAVVDSRAAFLAGIDALRARHPTPEGVPRPGLLRGVYLVPSRIEAWHGSPDRLHDRRVYTRTAAGWTEQTLVP